MLSVHLRHLRLSLETGIIEIGDAFVVQPR